eukprot:22707-Chlamydomonas_euryale.AAC.8
MSGRPPSGLLSWRRLSYNASREGVVAAVLGSDCYSQALRRLGRDCRSLADADRAALALHMLNCFLTDTSGRKVVCKRNERARDCTRRMDADTFGSYTVFYTNVHTLCVFVQVRPSACPRALV